MQDWQKAEKTVFEYFSARKDCYITRLSDTHDINAQLRRFGEKPVVLGKKRESDFLLVCPKGTKFVEVKCTENVRGITSSLFKSQKGKRDRILRAGGDYVYFIYSEVKGCWYVVPGSVIAENETATWDHLALFACYDFGGLLR